MFGLVRMNTKQVNWNKEYWFCPVLLVDSAGNDAEIIQIIVGALSGDNPWDIIKKIVSHMSRVFRVGFNTIWTWETSVLCFA